MKKFFALLLAALMIFAMAACSNTPADDSSSAPDGQTSENQPADDQSANEPNADGQTEDGQTSDGQTSGGQTSDGQTADGQTSGGQSSDGQSSDGSYIDEGLSEPVVNWSKVCKSNNTYWLVMEVSNPNSVPIEFSYSAVYYMDSEQTGVSQGLYYPSLSPGQKGLIFYNWDIPSECDKIDAILEYATEAEASASATASKEEKDATGVTLAFNVDGPFNAASVGVVFYNGNEIVGFDASYFISNAENEYHYSCSVPFDKYVYYANVF